MYRLKAFKQSLHILILAAFLSQMFGCGTILYPERKGQKGGRIDVGVAVLDGIGLLFFIIPGVIAYAVDFDTGAIYLPRGKSSLSPNGIDGIKVVRVNPGELNKETIGKIVERETGAAARLYSDRTEAYAFDRAADIRAKLTVVRNAGYRAITD